MSEKEFSLDDILSDLKDELKANGISDITDEEIKKYSVEMKKYDTATLLDEVNATLTEQKHFPKIDDESKNEESDEDKQTSSILNDSKKIEYYNKDDVKEKVNASLEKNNKPEEKESTDTIDESNKNEKEKLIKEIKSMTTEELKKQEELEEQRLRDLMLSTAHIKYISLRKNREKLVKEFVLNPQYTTTQPIEVHEKSKQIIDEELKKAKDDSGNKKDKQEKFKINDIDYEKLGFGKESLDDEVPEEYTDDKQTGNIFNYLKSMQGSLAKRLISLGVISVLAIIMTLFTMGNKTSLISFIDKTQHPLNFCIANLVLLVGAIAFSYDTILEGIYSIFQKSITRNTIFSIAFIAMLGVNIGILFEPKAIQNNAVNLCVPLASICAFGSMLGRYLDAKRRLLNFSILANKDKRYAVSIMENQKMAEDFTKAALEDYPTLVYNKKTTFLSYFMDESFGSDESDRGAIRVLPIVAGLALITLVVSLVLKQDIFVGLGVFNGILLVGTGVLPFLMISLPLYDTAKKLVPNGGAVLSVESAEDYTGVNSITLDATQIFDGQDVTLYGIKTFSDAPIDKVILDATTVLKESNSILGNVFLNIINNREDYLEKCDSLLYEDGMGISAWIGNRRILIGSRELMKNHNIDVPTEDFENKFIARDRSLIYLSTGGELSAVFMIGLECNQEIKQLVSSLNNNDIVCIIRTVDPILTRTTLSKVFGLPEKAFRVIPSRLHKELAEISETTKPISATVCNDGTLRGYIYSLLFAKKLPKITQISLAINYVVMGLAILLFVAFTFLNGVNQLNNIVLCGYQIGFGMLCYIMQKFYKL